MKTFGKIVALTGLLGWLPAVLALLAVQVALTKGAREWDDVTFSAVFVGLYLVLIGAGGYAYTRWFS